MKAVQKISVMVSWSGGKDSLLMLQQLQRSEQYEVVGLMTTVEEGSDRVVMHGFPIALIEEQARALGLPLEKIYLPAGAPNSIYEARMAETARQHHERGIDHWAYGDIYLEDIRRYRETLCQRIGMTPLFPLWEQDTHKLAWRFIREKNRAVLIVVDTRVLKPTFLGKFFNPEFLRRLPNWIDPCGERGEFHTFVFASPSFQFPVNVEVHGLESKGVFWVARIRSTGKADSGNDQ